MKVPEVCPRCKFNWIPNNRTPGEYPGAISRADNETEICSDCGVDEAVMQFTEGRIIPVEEWGVDITYRGDDPVQEWGHFENHLQKVDGGGKEAVKFIEDEEDILCRFIDSDTNRRITVITAPRETLNEDGPIVTQIADNEVIVMFADEFIERKVNHSYEVNKEEFGEMAIGIGLAFVMKQAMEAAVEKFNESY